MLSGGAVVQTPSVSLDEDVGIGPGAEFTPLLELPITVLKGPFLCVDFTFSADVYVAGPELVGAVFFRLLLDGVPVGLGTGGSGRLGPYSGAFSRRLEGIAPGVHTLTVEWRTPASTFAGIQPATYPDLDHANLKVMECIF